MHELSLQVLGELRIHHAAAGEIRITSRKGRALLAYLALRAGEPQSRHRLAALLWEDADEESARTSLRQALASLRRSMPGRVLDALIADGEFLALDPRRTQVDLGLFRAAIATGTCDSLHDAMRLWRGDLLEGVDARSGAFEEWLSAQRLGVRRELSNALHKLVEMCIANGDDGGALEAGTQLVALEPLNETAHRSLMRLHARRRAYTDALRQYRLCRDLLRRELDVAPEPATEDLYRSLMRRRRVAAHAMAPAPAVQTGRNPTMGSVDLSPGSCTFEKTATGPGAPSDVSRFALCDAVVLVVRMEGLLELEARLDAEDSHALSEAFQTHVGARIGKLGGVADRRVGANIVAIFGVPPADGREAERAARAALSLRDEFGKDPTRILETSASTPRRARIRATGSPLTLRCGIAMGQVVIGAVMFPLSGRTVHAAHTLALRAGDGEILLSQELRDALADQADVEPRSSSTWLLRTLAGNDAATRPLAGRRSELATMLTILARCAADRQGRVLMMRGEAGIGKTRLIDALRAAARDRGAAVHTAHVLDFGQPLRQGPIALLASSLLGVTADTPLPERRLAVRQTNPCADRLDELIFMSELAEIPLDAELAALACAMARTMDAAARRRGRASAMARLIESGARCCPLLLVVEDVHWADGEQLDQLSEIAAVIAHCPVLFVLSARPERDPVDAAWRTRARSCPVTTIDLAPLSDEESCELAMHYPQLDTETITACVRRAQGWPLFLDQLLRASAAGADALPGSVRSIIVARAAALTMQDRLAIHAAAVLGQRACLPALRHMIQNESYEPSGLVQAALVRFDGADLEFAHALFRDALYESLLKSHRLRLHEVAAAWFSDKDTALFAEHLAAAEDPRAAGAYADAAVLEQTALRFEKACSLARKAVRQAHEPSIRHRSQLLLGELLLQLGRTSEALAAYHESLDSASSDIDYGRTWFGLASALRIMDRHEEALTALDRSEVAFGEHADARMRACISTLRGNLCFPLGRIEDCLSSHERAYRYARRAGSTADVARACGGLGDAWYQRGRMRTAHEYFDRCVRQARENGLVDTLLAYLPMLALTHCYCGKPDAIQGNIDEAVQLARRAGDNRAELLAQLCMAACLQVRGRTVECRDCAQQALEIAGRLGACRFEAEAMSVIALSLASSRPEEAAQLAEQALRLGRQTGMSYAGPVLLGVVARLTPDTDRRAEVLAEGEALLAAGCVSHSYFEFYANAIEVALRTRAWSEARRYGAALQAYTADQPLPLTDLVIRRALLLADLGESGGTSGDEKRAEATAALQALCADCRRIDALAILPELEAALPGSGPAPAEAG